LGKNIPNNQEIGRANGNKIFQMAVNDHIAITYQHRPLQDPPKFTQIGIFGLKIYHLATLVWRTKVFSSCLVAVDQIFDRKTCFCDFASNNFKSWGLVAPLVCTRAPKFFQDYHLFCCSI
jgi:hypothetical protein